MSENSLCDLVADTHHGIERGHGFLEDHGNARAAELAHGVIGQSWETAGVAVLREKNFPGHPRLRRKKAHDGEGSNRFARAGFADQTEDFAGSDGES